MFSKILGVICVVAGVVYIIFDIVKNVKKYKNERVQKSNKTLLENNKKESDQDECDCN